MADSTCVKCGNDTFEVQEVTPSGATGSYMFVQCSSCGGVVGVEDSQDVGAMMKKQNTAIKLIAQQFGMRLDLD